MQGQIRALVRKDLRIMAARRRMALGEVVLPLLAALISGLVITKMAQGLGKFWPDYDSGTVCDYNNLYGAVYTDGDTAAWDAVYPCFNATRYNGRQIWVNHTLVVNGSSQPYRATRPAATTGPRWTRATASPTRSWISRSLTVSGLFGLSKACGDCTAARPFF